MRSSLLNWVILITVLAGAGFYSARNYGGEVATLYTTDHYGRTFRTKLWVIGEGSNVWIRASAPTSPWLDRVVKHPAVELRRGEGLTSYTATPLLHRRSQVNSKMAERYGWAEWILAQVEDRTVSVPIYLDPFS